MTDRVIVTDVADLDVVLDALDRAAAVRGWRVRRPTDAAALQTRAREARAALRLASPVTVVIEPDPDAAPATDAAGGPAAAVDARAMLARTPVAGALADDVRRPHGG